MSFFFFFLFFLFLKLTPIFILQQIIDARKGLKEKGFKFDWTNCKSYYDYVTILSSEDQRLNLFCVSSASEQLFYKCWIL